MRHCGGRHPPMLGQPNTRWFLLAGRQPTLHTGWHNQHHTAQSLFGTFRRPDPIWQSIDRDRPKGIDVLCIWLFCKTGNKTCGELAGPFSSGFDMTKHLCKKTPLILNTPLETMIFILTKPEQIFGFFIFLNRQVTKQKGMHLSTFLPCIWVNYNNISWLVVEPPLWKILVSWDDCSQYMEKMFQTTNQFQ